MPSGFSVTSPDKRGWFISPLGDKRPFPTWLMGASVVPALLVFILIFMETQITSYVWFSISAVVTQWVWDQHILSSLAQIKMGNSSLLLLLNINEANICHTQLFLHIVTVGTNQAVFTTANDRTDNKQPKTNKKHVICLITYLN